MRYVFFVAGAAAALLAVFANILGIDNSPAWGKGRLLLFIAGAALAVGSLAVHLWKTGRVPAALRARLSPWGRRISLLARRITGCGSLTPALAGLALLLVLVYAAWYMTAGKFPLFPVNSGPYYPRLGESFLHGQLSLPQTPDPRLLALPNPYDNTTWGDIPVQWDASLYQGKYYLYWGPAPAVVFAAVKAVTGVRPLSPVVALGAFTVLVAAVMALLLTLRRRYFPRAPGISVAIFLLAAGINLPMQFILGRPSTYETSILFGQVFLMLGLLAWVLYLDRQRPFWLALAGLGWGLAVASRHTMLFSAVIYTAFALVHFLRTCGGLKRLPWTRIATLLAPLALCALGLALYNYARFGNPLETGASYQLTLAVPVDRYFSLAYLGSNLYVWLLYPLHTAEVFPFYKANRVLRDLLPVWAAMPRYKMFDESFFGLLPSVPLLWLAPLAFFTAGQRAAVMDERRRERRELLAMVLAAGLVQLVTLLVFYFGAMRYIADFYLPVLLALAFAAWALDERLVGHGQTRAVLWIVTALLALATVGIGFFAGFAVPPGVFRSGNPALYKSLEAAWTPFGHYLAGLLRLPGRLLGL